ncbi:MAG: alpha/beta hydrolase family protein [Solirubrobacterales bacterium]
MPPPARRPPTHPPPSREGTECGLAYTLWLPDEEPPWPGILILHGAGSCKESHADFARLARASGWAALGFDARGHGASEGGMSPGAVEDVVAMAALLAGERGVDSERVIVRGSSMGGFLALHAAAVSAAIAGVIAICPASEDGLRRGLKRGRFEMRIHDLEGLRAWLGEHDLREAVELIGPRPLIFLHAEGDDQVPLAWTRELHDRAIGPRKLIVEPGGNHRSVQHDAELQATALRWIERALG